MAIKSSFSFVVKSIPPVKQTPADTKEKENIEERKTKLKEEAKKLFTEKPPFGGPCAVSIRYFRHKGKADSANIVGGVLDSLQGIVIEDDKQVIEIAYTEWSGKEDWYQITITEAER